MTGLIWENTDDYLLGKTENFTYKNKLAMFDLDDTLIKVKSQKKFPIDEDDWEWNYYDVRKTLIELYDSDHTIIIVSNQGGIELGKTDPEVWMKKIDKIYCKILKSYKVYSRIVKSCEKFEMMVFCSTGKNKYRKPLPFFYTDLIPIDARENFDHEHTFYCGDCAGRNNDRTDTDYKFALNCKINFKSPEEIFFHRTPEVYTAKYPQLPNSLSCNCPKGLEKFKPKKKEMIIMVGFPGSGKSYVSSYLNNEYGYEIINQDALKTKSKCLKKMKNLVGLKKNIVIDCTNPSEKSRKVWFDVADSCNYTVRIIEMTTSCELSKHNNYYRHVKSNIRLVPDIAYNIYKKNYEKPKKSIRVNEIIYVDPSCPDDDIYKCFMF